MCSIRHRYANYFLKEVVLLAWNFFYPMFPQIRTDRYLVCMLVNYCSITACIPIESQNPFQHSSSPVPQSIRVTWEIKNVSAIPGTDNYRNNILGFIPYILLCLVHLLACGCVSMKLFFL